LARSRHRAHAERTRATRSRIIEAATPLFVRDGYLETTMSGIAKAAGVAVQTLYLSFGSKVAVLEAAIDAAAEHHPIGDDEAAPPPGSTLVEPRPIEPRPIEPRPIESQPIKPQPIKLQQIAADGPAALTAHVHASAAAVEREYPLAAVLRAAAADPEPAALLERTRQAALATHAAAVDELADRPGFSDQLSLLAATEMVATLLAPETYGLLVVNHGWTPQDWSAWTARHLIDDLFPAAAAHPRAAALRSS
jgi:AcrR family transcriptional regulator